MPGTQPRPTCFSNNSRMREPSTALLAAVLVKVLSLQPQSSASTPLGERQEKVENLVLGKFMF